MFVESAWNQIFFCSVMRSTLIETASRAQQGHADGRPSIWDRCCQRPRAVYLRARAGSPRTLAQRRREPPPLDLAPGGVYLADRVTSAAGGLLHHRFTLTAGRSRRRFVLCGTVPRVTPGGCWPPPCPVEPGLSSTLPEGHAAVARPARPPFDQPSGRPRRSQEAEVVRRVLGQVTDRKARRLGDPGAPAVEDVD